MKIETSKKEIDPNQLMETDKTVKDLFQLGIIFKNL
jgi:hypothetical protein